MSDDIAIFEAHQILRHSSKSVTFCNRLSKEGNELVTNYHRSKTEGNQSVTKCHRLKLEVADGQKGGRIAKNARLELEKKTGKRVITGENYLLPETNKKLDKKYI